MEKYKIKDICTVLNGRAYKYEELQDSGKYRILRVGNFFSKDDWYYSDMELEDNKYCYNGDLLYAWSANFGPKIWNGEKTIYHYHIWKMVPNENVDKLFLYYKLFSITDRLKDSSHGSVMLHLTKSDMENFVIELPTLTEQRKIGKILKDIDDKIELNNEINNNLYKLIKNNYESLINGCNWEEVELGSISNITSGKRPVDKSEIGEYPVIGANGIMAYTSDYNFSEDLIITGRVGTLGVVKRYLGKIWASDNTLVIQTKYLNYIENYLKTIDYYSLNRGSTQPLLTQADLKKQIIYFNEALVTKFEKDNQIFVDKIRNNEKENSKLIQLRDTLLPKLMNGEINLDNIEI